MYDRSVPMPLCHPSFLKCDCKLGVNETQGLSYYHFTFFTSGQFNKTITSEISTCVHCSWTLKQKLHL